jgi:hypothetical protein
VDLKFSINKSLRTLCFAFIYFYCNFAWAEFWLPYWYARGFISHYDPTSIERVGDEVQLEIMTDRDRRMYVNQREYKSTTTIEKIHCKNKTFSMLSIQTWSEQMGLGKIVYSNYEPFAVDMEIFEGTNSEELFKIACKPQSTKLSEQ